MEYDLPVAQMARGDDIEGFYVLKSAFSKVANNGKPFLNLTLSDRTGAVDAKVWDYPGPIGAADEGKVVKIRGSVSEFRGALQVTVERIRLAGEGDRYDVTALVPTAPIDGEAMYASVEALLDSITDADYKAVCRELLRRHSESFHTIPAAKSVHHGFLHGLLMHTGNMMQLADFLAGMYADTVDRSLLLAGTFAHDLQKEREFRFSALGMVTDYSVPGQLLGHLVMGAQEIAEIAKELDVPEEKSVLLRHLVLSHHGEPEFGAAVRPMFLEAEILSSLDTLDAKIYEIEQACRNVQPGEFTPRQWALDNRKLYNHDRNHADFKAELIK